MKLTNRLDLPHVLVRAIANDPYDDGRPDHLPPDRYLTASGIGQPPLMRRLLQEHRHELQEDASERIWSLIGQATHSIVERAGDGLEGWLIEDRFTAFRSKGQWLPSTDQPYELPLHDWTVTGQADMVDLQARCLYDLKITGTYSVQAELKQEWKLQINCLAWLLKLHGIEIEQGKIICILRDWSQNKHRFKTGGKNYPDSQVVVLDIPLQLERFEKWLAARIEVLQEEQPRPCTDHERWKRGKGWAVMKEGGKRAIKTFDTDAEAQLWINEQNDQEQLRLEGREVHYQRCEAFCPVRHWCEIAQGECKVEP